MSVERDLLGKWHNGDLLPEEYMQLMKETKELLAQPEQDNIQYLLDQVARLTAENAMLKEKWLAQPETKQEPVAWCQIIEGKVQDLLTSFEMKDWLYDKSWIPLYLAQPKREPLGLEIMDACGTEDYREGFKDGALYAEKCHGIGVDDE